MGLRLAGDLINEVDDRGVPIRGDTLLLLLNAHWEEIPFTLPATSEGQVWEALIDTNDPDMPLRVARPGEQYKLFGRSLALLRTSPAESAGDETTPAQLGALRKEASRAHRPLSNDIP